jgi:hypothetical protein
VNLAYWALCAGWLSGYELGRSLRAGPRLPVLAALPAIAATAALLWERPALGAWPGFGLALGGALVWAAALRLAAPRRAAGVGTWAAPLEAWGTVLTLGFFVGDWLAAAAGGVAGMMSAWVAGDRLRADGLFPVLWGTLGSAELWQVIRGGPWLGVHPSLWWTVGWLLATEGQLIWRGALAAKGGPPMPR